ncbi:MAG: hypothetical protein M3082_21610 [Candidatus Dormibacteraeota bacterium]|nr:hypothetical protein [Candidatus Dormibacteraeota bacterium]
MQVDKQSVIEMIRQQGGDQRASEAAEELPDQIDHEQHAELLHKYGINPQDLASSPGDSHDAGGTLLGDNAQDLETRVGGSNEAGGTLLGPRPS